MDMNYLRIVLGVSRRDEIKNDEIRKKVRLTEIRNMK